ncbi:MAG: aminotransferase class I/II-fold pyridoxal phosphate-dependent enzyme [Lysobacterales bacterium]|nr:MAG: aminotransferase class I/II-fold pyridoxal phosphate-dependent enzyme [Xanthomonadales bacterium]
MRKRSRVTHLPEVRVPEDNRPLVAPIYQSVKFTFDDVEETLRQWNGQREGYYYSRVSNPTLRQLEIALADLQDRDACLLTASGVAAIALPLLGLLEAGQHVVYFAELYPPTRSLVRRLLGRYGVRSTMLTLSDPDSLERTLATVPTRLVLLESPSNPVLRVVDLERVTAAARRHGALTMLDNTLGGLHNHGRYDVDLYVHSLTKYASGHGDVMGGAVIGRRELVDALRDDAINLGATLDPHAAWLVLRGLKTYFLRWEAQCANALRVAQFLAGRTEVERVRYPGLPADPGHELATRQMDGYGTIVTFDLRDGTDAATRFAEALELFAITSSLGSTESLVVPPALQQPRGLDASQAAWTGIGPGTVRLSIGIEDADDLVSDLGQALARSAANDA